MNNTINLQQLAAALAAATNSSSEQCETFIKSLITDISNRLTTEGQCVVPHIGKFIVDHDAGDILFTPEESLAVAVNEPFSVFEPVELAVEESQLAEDASAEPEPIPEPELPVEQETIPGDEAPMEEEMLPLEQIAEPVSKVETNECEKVENIITNEQEVIEEPEEYYDTEDEDNEIVVETRAWPVVVGVLVGLITGVIIGLLLYRPIFGERATGNVEINSSSTSADTVAVYIIDNPNINDTLSTAEANTTVLRDTVTPHNFLATMARKYYGVMEYWIFIYEENHEILPANPNRITPGTVVIIPDINKYVNPADKAAAKAQAQHKIAQLEQTLH